MAAAYPPQALALRSPLSIIFLVHAAMDGPIAMLGAMVPEQLPFIDMTNTTVIMIKLYSCLVFGSCIASVLCYSLPDFLPGKRALALGLLMYHVTASSALFYSPRFIPFTLGPLPESLGITAERIWAAGHGLVVIGLSLWWQLTLQFTKMVKQGKVQ